MQMASCAIVESLRGEAGARDDVMTIGQALEVS
jgi:hypothetical protein